ncbi:hypothetical protein CJP72_25395 [Citrobacter sp. NCU1]|uniref:DUF7716 domain-containing protein n=1 Tax=Citrobacter sp. NCU1 TaxID=2026683 RepID=UPI001391FCE8|nr:hypothetical protein [Citrobacter sp. NCU1]NDO83942.1 hypothetical protein [Citrobacter sp. NCU1]
MKTVKGFDGLLAIYKKLPKVGGFYVDNNFLNKKAIINNSNYYVPQSEEEDDDMEDVYKTWLEFPTFTAIIENKLEHHPDATKDDLLDAVVYYLEEDDFLD